MHNIPVTHFFHIEGVPKELQKVFLREYAANGVKHIVLTDAMILNIMTDANEKKFYRELLDSTPVTYLDSHAPFGLEFELSHPEKHLHKQKVYRLLLAMEIASEFGIKTMTMHTGGIKYPSISLQEHISEMLFTLEELLPAAKALDLTLCLENVWHSTNTPEVLLELLSKFPGEKNLGLCFDAGHANLMGGKTILSYPESKTMQSWKMLGKLPPLDENILEKMLPYIVNCHLHDNDGSEDNHSIPGNGTVNWKKVMTTLSKAPRLKCIQNETSEPFQKNVTSGTSIRTMLEKFDSILQYLS